MAYYRASHPMEKIGEGVGDGDGEGEGEGCGVRV